MRYFNTTGPCRPEKHYMIPALTRLQEQADIARLIRQEAYFVMHAPRQMGKTTAMRELARNLTDLLWQIAIFYSR
jgi:hypothetical protein